MPKTTMGASRSTLVGALNICPRLPRTQRRNTVAARDPTGRRSATSRSKGSATSEYASRTAASATARSDSSRPPQMHAQSSTASAAAGPSQASSRNSEARRSSTFNAWAEPSVDAAAPAGEPAILVLGIDDIDLDAVAQSAHRDGREQVGLSRARMPEHPDVCIGVAVLIEGVDEHWRARVPVAADHQPTARLQVRFVPRKEGDQRCRVDDPLALEAVRTSWLRGNVAVQHPKHARLGEIG